MAASRQKWVIVVLAACGAVAPAYAVDLRGLLDLRWHATDAEQSVTQGGLDKSRYDRSRGAFRLGQAQLRADADLLEAWSASVVLSASDDRAGIFDVTEAWVAWNPLPSGVWKTRLKVGAFFPATSFELDYDSLGWTPQHTVSSSALNNWMGEELRTKGIEVNWLRKGRQTGSPHDIGLTAALFTGNDPIGSLLAWRGWSVGDRLAGVTEAVPLPDLPVFRAGAELAQQSRAVSAFKEIDDRWGYYLGASYGYALQDGSLELSVMHYDNRGDPLAIRGGQYSWHTRFNHVGARLRGLGQWELAGQALQGNTLMGPGAVHLDFSAFYLLATHPLGPGTVALRFDKFSTQELQSDVMPQDPNTEDGRALALAYHWRINPQWSLVTESLTIQSRRAARALLGQPPDRIERSLTTSLRWRF